MFKHRVTTLTTILKNNYIQECAGNTFENIINAVSLGDVEALLDTATDIKKLLFHAPPVLK